MRAQSGHFEYPLDWPEGVPRTRDELRDEGLATEHVAVIELRHEMRAFGLSSYTISTNDRYLGRDPRGPAPPRVHLHDDPGCAVYFARKYWDGSSFYTSEYCICSDSYDDVLDNLTEIAKTVRHLSKVKRDCSSQIFLQFMSAFELMPERIEDAEEVREDSPGPQPQEETPNESEKKHVPSQHKRWFRALGLKWYPKTLDEAEQAYRKLIKEYHPDVGGDAEETLALNDAIESARNFFENR